MHHSIIISRTGGTDVLERVAARGVVPAAGQVLVRNRAAAVNFIDTLIRRGAMPPDAMPSLPHTWVLKAQALWKPWAPTLPHLLPVIGSHGWGR